MGMPKSVIKLDKNGFKFTDNVDAVQYTLEELSRAALRDVGKFVVSRARANAPRRTGRGRRFIQYWVRKGDTRVEVGVKRQGFHMVFNELGSGGNKKSAMIYNAAHDNISQIIEIEKKYLSGIESPNVESLIDEDDYEGGEENE